MDQQDPSPDRDTAARYVVAARRMLKEAVTAELALNPAVDMLLALYLTRHAGGSIAKADVCAATSVTEQVCHHWGAALAQRGFVTIEGDRYRLSEQGERVMDAVNDNVWTLAAEHLGAVRAPR